MPWLIRLWNTHNSDAPRTPLDARLIGTGASPLAVSNYAEPETLQAFKAGDAALMRNWLTPGRNCNPTAAPFRDAWE